MMRIILFFVFLCIGITCIKFPEIAVADPVHITKLYSTAPVMYAAFTAIGLMLVLILLNNKKRVERESEMVDEIGSE